MPLVWLLRHGSSVANEGEPSSDSWQIPLTAKGEAEAREAARRWSGMVESRSFRLVTSPMLRAQQTAEQVMLLHPEVAAEVVDDVREFEPFDFSHLPPMRPQDRRQWMAPYWDTCDPERVGEGLRAESFSQFVRRVCAALAELGSNSPLTLVVCHGGVIKLMELLMDPKFERVSNQVLMREWWRRPAAANGELRPLHSHWPENGKQSSSRPR